MFKRPSFAKLNTEIPAVLCIMVVDFCIKFYFYIAYYDNYIHVKHWEYVKNFCVQ
jgi:hypothetical protein